MTSDFNFFVEVFEKVTPADIAKLQINSPLEKAFLGFWFVKWGLNCVDNEGSLLNKNVKESEYIRKIIPQYRLDLNIHHYIKIDFVFICVCASKKDMNLNSMHKEQCEILYKPGLYPKEFRVAVELDGHTYHERTKEQVAERNIRDCELQKRNYAVHHISYSQLAHNFSNSLWNLSDTICAKAASVRDTL